MNRQLQQSIRDYVNQYDLDGFIGVTLTMKQLVNGVRLTEGRSSQNFRHYMNCLNSKLLGKKFKRFGQRINVFPVSEYSETDRIHYHLIIEKPEHIPMWLFVDDVKNQWRKTNFGYEQVKIDRKIDTGWVDYITKFKSNKDDVDWENVSLN